MCQLSAGRWILGVIFCDLGHKMIHVYCVIARSTLLGAHQSSILQQDRLIGDSRPKSILKHPTTP